MRIVLSAVFCGCLLAAAHPIFAQDSCNLLLRHGITERLREQRMENRSQRNDKAICAAYDEYRQDVAKGGAKASYSLFDGSATFGRSQIEYVGKAMCSSDFSNASSENLVEFASDSISPSAIAAWRECLALHKDGLESETQFRDDNGTVQIRLRYVAPKGVTSSPAFNEIVIFPKGSFICEGPLARMKPNEQITSNEISMLCQRQAVNNEIAAMEGKAILLPASSISVMTTAGSITRHVSAVFKSPASPPQRLGEIVASMLDQITFSEVYGPGWVLADGRAVPNSAYARLVSPTVPDLRGVYLRGKNYERQPKSGNAEGDLPLGTFQPFQIVRHSHSTIQMIGDNSVDGVDSVVQHSGEHHNEGRQTGEFGGDEVRPNSITVNFFIRVDGL